MKDSNNEAYRKKFPKGKDWKDPKPNPYGFCGLHPDSYHGMETIAISIDKHNEVVKELKDKISEIDTFVTEQGDVEDWKHNKKQYEETITKKVLEYSSLVRKRLE